MTRADARLVTDRRGMALIVAASALGHALLLWALWLHRPTAAGRAMEAYEPGEIIVPVIIDAARRLSLRPSGAPALSASRTPPPQRDQPPAGGAAVAPPGATPVETASASPPAAGGAATPGPDLSRVLQRGLVACADVGRLSDSERERCAERLAAGAARAPQYPLSIEPRIKAYYAAVAEAKAPDRPPVPLGPPGMLVGDMRGAKGHGPAVGCAFTFGGGKGPKAKAAPPHALKLGPCFIAPPAGSLSPDVDVVPP
jgi:hypothetical protein